VSVRHIQVRLSRLKFMSIDDCDTDEAMDAIIDAVRTALTTQYPKTDVLVAWQTGRSDREYDIVEVEWRDEGENGSSAPNAEAAVARLVELAGQQAVSALFLPRC
jgi:hypothetical protein